MSKMQGTTDGGGEVVWQMKNSPNMLYTRDRVESKPLRRITQARNQCLARVPHRAPELHIVTSQCGQFWRPVLSALTTWNCVELPLSWVDTARSHWPQAQETSRPSNTRTDGRIVIGDHDTCRRVLRVMRMDPIQVSVLRLLPVGSEIRTAPMSLGVRFTGFVSTTTTAHS